MGRLSVGVLTGCRDDGNEIADLWLPLQLDRTGLGPAKLTGRKNTGPKLVKAAAGAPLGFAVPISKRENRR
jgi:hypothetical protein